MRKTNHRPAHRREFLATSAALAGTLVPESLKGGSAAAAVDHPVESHGLVDPFDAAAIAQAARCFQPVLRIPGHYINDHCVVRDEAGVFHLYFILGEVGKGCYTPGNEVIIGHATSKNLLAWDLQPHALEGQKAGPYWESAHIFAPYVVRHAGLYWMFYCGDTPGRGQRIGLATSSDLGRGYA